MSIMKELDTLNQEIQSATRELDQAKGKKSAMIDTLKKMEKQLEKLSGEIETKFNKLKEEYEW